MVVVVVVVVVRVVVIMAQEKEVFSSRSVDFCSKPQI